MDVGDGGKEIEILANSRQPQGRKERKTQSKPKRKAKGKKPEGSKQQQETGKVGRVLGLAQGDTKPERANAILGKTGKSGLSRVGPPILHARACSRGYRGLQDIASVDGIRARIRKGQSAAEVISDSTLRVGAVLQSARVGNQDRAAPGRPGRSRARPL